MTPIQLRTSPVKKPRSGCRHRCAARKAPSPAGTAKNNRKVVIAQMKSPALMLRIWTSTIPPKPTISGDWTSLYSGLPDLSGQRMRSTARAFGASSSDPQQTGREAPKGATVKVGAKRYALRVHRFASHYLTQTGVSAHLVGYPTGAEARAQLRGAPRQARPPPT